jgi:HK97 family phage prohead protease
MIDIEVAREQASRARREAVEDTSPDGIQRARCMAPLDVGLVRRMTVPAVLRSTLETRAGSPDENREWNHLSGVASTTETAYEMWDMFGPYTEKVSATAFNNSLARNPDVAFLVNHTGLTMARTTNGKLTLSAGPQGLVIDAWLNPDRNDVRDLGIAITDGDIDQMSFAAMLEEGQWNEDYTEFVMLQLDLDRGDVSAVNYGANPTTSISARARRVMDEVDRLPTGAARIAMRHLQVRLDATSGGEQRSTRAPQDAVVEEPPTETPMGRSINLVRTIVLADDE